MVFLIKLNHHYRTFTCIAITEKKLSLTSATGIIASTHKRPEASKNKISPTKTRDRPSKQDNTRTNTYNNSKIKIHNHIIFLKLTFTRNTLNCVQSTTVSQYYIQLKNNANKRLTAVLSFTLHPYIFNRYVCLVF